MPTPLLTSEDRRALTDAIVLLLSANHCLTASQLADWFQCTPSQIHSVLLSLRARGVVEGVDVTGNSFHPGQYVWRIAEHAFHDPQQVLPGTPRCEYCRRTFSAR